MSQISTKFIANNAVTTAKLASVTGTGTTVVLSASPTLTGTLNVAAVSATGALNMNSNLINNVTNPVSAQDAATKSYVDAAINGLTWKGPVQAYAASNVPLSGSPSTNTLTIDGYSVQNGDFVILANQTTASENYVYVASGIGGTFYLLNQVVGSEAPTAIGDAYLVENGTLYGNSAFQVNQISPNVTFIQFAGPQALSYTAPLSISGSTVSISQATTSTNGYLTSTDWNTFNNKQPAGNYITALTGDVTASGPGSAAATLATVNGNVGSFGSSTSIPSFTVNAKGLITAASGNAVIAPAGTLTGTTLASNVVTSSLTTVGTIGTGTWQGTAIGAIYGGTGQTSYTTGDTLYASATNTLSKLPIGSSGQVLTVSGGVPVWSNASAGTVTSVSVTTANGFAGTVATATTTPAITISTTVTGILYGNGTSVAAAVAANFPTITDGITTNQSGASSTIQSLRPISYAYTLTSTNITNQYVDLDVANGFPSNDPAYGTSALTNSVALNPAGGPLQTKGVDFTVSLTGGSSGSTRVTFAGDLATGGNAALIAGDVVTFSYSYL